MTVAHILWIINIVLALFACYQGRYTVLNRRRRSMQARRRFLKEAREHLDRLPDSTEKLTIAWQAVIRQSGGPADLADARVSAVRALDRADDRTVAVLRDLVKEEVNVLNAFAELVDEGLVRPMDIARQNPGKHVELLQHLPLIAPFIWYETILQGRGRWGYRVLRLETIFERLRVVSPRSNLRGPLEIEIDGFHFQALEGVTAAERVLGSVRLWIRSPTINVHSKVAQARERLAMISRLKGAGMDIARGGGSPGPAVDW